MSVFKRGKFPYFYKIIHHVFLAIQKGNRVGELGRRPIVPRVRGLKVALVCKWIGRKMAHISG